MNNVDLNDMRLFVAVVQAGSLSKAADLLCQPKSRLSRRLTRLENTLGTALLASWASFFTPTRKPCSMRRKRQ